MEAYQKNNLKLKNIIKVDNVTLDKLVSQIPLYSNCIFSGGIEVESIGGGRVYNRRLILSKFIKRIIEYYPSGGVIFYNSTYIKKIMKKWSLEYSGRKKIVFLDDEAYNYDPFKGMNKEEIIYTITNISNFVGISIDQYAQLFLEYIIKLLFISKYELNYKNILTLIYRNNEELSLIARELGLISEAKYFSKTGNGSEAIKRICFTIDNFIRSNFSDNSTNMTNVISEIKKGNIVFIYIKDQYQSEILEYLTNELKCISHYNPYLIFDDVVIKNNKNLEELLIKTNGIRFCLSSLDLGGMVTTENIDSLKTLAPTKLMFHYDDLNAAEKISNSVGYYYYLKTTKEKSKSKEIHSISFFDANVTEGTSITEEKRDIIEGIDLMNLNERQLYFIDKSIEKYFINNVDYDK